MNNIITNLNIFRVLLDGEAETSPTPFEILGKRDNTYGNLYNFRQRVGLVQLEKSIEVFGIFLAVVVILGAIVTLLVVNYPKTVSQTKTKIVHAFMVIALIGSLAFILDIVLTVIWSVFGLTS